MSGEIFDQESERVSAFDSEASRINFWKDYNIEKKVVVVDKVNLIS